MMCKALNPSGYALQVDRVPLAPRLSDLEGKTIILISFAASTDPAMDRLCSRVEEALTNLHAKVIMRKKMTAFNRDDAPFWDEIQQSGHGFVYFGTGLSAPTTFSAIWTAELEKRGLPGVNVIFDLFESAVQATRENRGTPVRIVTVPFPFETAGEERVSGILNRVVKGLLVPLTDEEQRTGQYLPPRPPRIGIEATWDDVQRYFYESGWTDGLPIIIPTEDKVTRMLKGTAHEPDEVVTNTMWPGRLTTTVEKVAVNGVMAGCRQEYMPVLLAAVEAFASGDYAGPSVSANSFSWMQVVNGPIRNQIGMNAGIFALGPGNHANATIGRALRLFIHNLGGGRVGENIMGVQGNVSAYSFCFPENEEGSPWEPFHASEGRKRDESVITIFAGGWSHVGNYIFQGIEGLAEISEAIARFESPNGAAILMSPSKARKLSGLGLSKQDVEQRIWSGATITTKRFKESCYYRSLIEPDLRGPLRFGWPREYLDRTDDQVIQAYPRKHVKVIVVGGEVADMMQGWKMAYPSTASIDKWR
jgi:hypothetical protein